MRLDLRYLAGGLLLGALLLVNALIAPDAGPLGVVGVSLVVVMAAAVAVSPRHPVTALALVTVAMLALHLRVHAGVTAAFPVIGLVYLTAWRGHRLPAALAGVVFLGVFLARDIAVAPGGQAAQQLVERTSLLLGWFVAANVAGVVGRQRRAYLEQVEQRAVEAERTREEMALRRAGEERLRIARDLHDSLTHSISVIKVQAGIAVHLARKRGEEPPAALLAIQEAGGAAMRELRETLDVLRAPSDTQGVGLAHVEALAERTRAAGFPVRVSVSGDAPELPADVDRAGYRVVQEALTNIARHAGPASAEIAIEHTPAQLAISITDDGLASPDHPAPPGVGLSGMRERVVGLGGELRAAPRDGGGFAVRATFPLNSPRPDAAPESRSDAAGTPPDGSGAATDAAAGTLHDAEAGMRAGAAGEPDDAAAGVRAGHGAAGDGAAGVRAGGGAAGDGAG